MVRLLLFSVALKKAHVADGRRKAAAISSMRILKSGGAYEG